MSIPLPDPEPIPTATATLRDPRAEVTDAEWASLVRTVLDSNPGMAEKLADRIVDQALAFVVTAAVNPHLAMAPSRVVDEGWHAALVHSRVYAIICTRNGAFVHHSPGYNPENYDPSILQRTQDAMRATGFEVDAELWAGPLDGTYSVAAKCQHAPECAIRPMPTPQPPVAA